MKTPRSIIDEHNRIQDRIREGQAMKHTPGTWYRREYTQGVKGTGGDNYAIYTNNHGGMIAKVIDQNDKQETSDNADLITASKEMYEALLIVQDRINRGWFPFIRPDDVWPNAVARAIAKAEGRE